MQSNTRGSAEAREWANEQAARVGAEVHRLRTEVHRISAVQLAERTAELGYPITRGTIAKIESNSRAAKLDVAELAVLAKALCVPPIQLLYPQLPDGPVEVLPNVRVRSVDAMTWFSGEEMEYTDNDLGVSRAANDTAEVRREKWECSLPVRATRSLLFKKEGIRSAELMVEGKSDAEHVEFWVRRLEERTRELIELREKLRQDGLYVSDSDG
ncbi:hypothetical protein [Rhodococcus sp. AH-ZY2]|uniref:helix-turn-helix domain-containing protein n=1 Tax=Rhodococcus sp. AH-ZY2 TaxID=3047468 RepID=UPI0027E1D615|nr:hypothetical protein [Rhodococcus sp. AH-ZY2]WML61904.1 hypothetical protein QNA09_18890 [Rhodococcus sp. AH-ZY2]